jgi:hypothetical protein
MALLYKYDYDRKQSKVVGIGKALRAYPDLLRLYRVLYFIGSGTPSLCSASYITNESRHWLRMKSGPCANFDESVSY